MPFRSVVAKRIRYARPASKRPWRASRWSFAAVRRGAAGTEPLKDGDDLRLELTSLIRPGESDLEDLRWPASSSDESVVTARGWTAAHLAVAPELSGEGAAEIVLQATDDACFAATLRFNVQAGSTGRAPSQRLVR